MDKHFHSHDIKVKDGSIRIETSALPEAKVFFYGARVEDGVDYNTVYYYLSAEEAEELALAILVELKAQREEATNDS